MASCPVATVLTNAAQNNFVNSALAPYLIAELLAEAVKGLSPSTDVTAAAVERRANDSGLKGPGMGPQQLAIITAQNLCDCIGSI